MNEQPTFEIKQEEKKDNYAKFVISPLEQGYGNTLGNSLRRVLLTSLGGAAVTSVKITGVKHQFSSLKGMKEDVVEFILNLKKVRFVYGGEDPIKATISAEGPGEITAKGIEVSGDIEIANPELVLANLSKDGKLNATIEIESGSGYRSAEERENKEIGLIPVDASFSPITRVNYTVEETRVGRRTNFDKLNLEIWTDGTVEPKGALVKASKILVSYLNQIISPKKVEKKEEEKDEGLGPVGKLSVEEIGLPTRVANALVKAGYETVEDLAAASKDDLTKVRNLGEKSVKIIAAALGEKDVTLEE
jgi:DNA-directed RNA polymerase subunit alpha